MKLFRVFSALCAAALVSGCMTVDGGSTASRNAFTVEPPLGAELVEADGTLYPAEPYNVVQINTTVPETLSVSEANSFKPRADIVWREDPLGNRYEQVRVIMQNAVELGAAGFDAGRDVVVDIQLTKFHALTEKTRYTIGGTHDIHFFLTVRDAKTGERLDEPRLIEMEFRALGGAAALEAMSRGQTQKVRITDHVKARVAEELTLRSTPLVQPLTLSALSSRGI
jgi:hypothetical protein|tara:strand:+ start:1060 stop:1734 length:675 start_codon:yes stop_codon:yes gene_type:complete